MKGSIFLVAFVLVSVFSWGQNVKIISDDDLVTDIGGTEIEVIGEKTDMYILKKLHVVNIGSKPIKMAFKRARLINGGSIDQICDNNMCYSADDSYFYTTPDPQEIAVGDTSLFKPQIMPGSNDVCAFHKYYVVSPTGSPYDSITIRFKTTGQDCQLGIKQQEKPTFKIYPNPAQDGVTIQGEGLKNGGTIVFQDALGQEVKRVYLSEMHTLINVSALNKGIYFVSITDNKGVKSKVQRLVVQ